MKRGTSMTREEAARDIAKIVHAYDHPEYDTCTWCVFCLGYAENLLDALPPQNDTDRGGA